MPCVIRYHLAIKWLSSFEGKLHKNDYKFSKEGIKLCVYKNRIKLLEKLQPYAKDYN